MTQINAHRGDPLGFRENTMPAFASAVQLGADCIELDIQASLDDQAVVLHDETLERLWGIPHAVSQLAYAEILRRSRDGDLVVPLLDDVLSSFALPIMVDFTAAASVPLIIRCLRQQRAARRCIVSSGNIPALFAIRQDLPDVAIALTWDDVVLPSDALLQQLDVQYLNPTFHLYQDDFIRAVTGTEGEIPMDVDAFEAALEARLERRRAEPTWFQLEGLCGAHLVERMHAAQRKTSAWTVDDPAVMREMMDLGVDLVTTNDIKTFVEVRHDRRAQ